MTQQNYTFSYSVSTREYDRNKDERQTAFLKWREKQGTVNDLLTDIKNGLAFCPTFHHDGDVFTNKAKRKTNLKATYFLTFDFDAVRLTAGEFYGCMIGTAITPSAVYTTANNGKFKEGKNETYCNRYRVLYVLDQPLTTAEDYTTIHQALKAEIATTVGDNNIFNDTSDKDVSHFFAGCKETDAYSNNSVISLTWLCDRYSVELCGEGIRTRSNDCFNETISSHADTNPKTDASNTKIVETQKGQKYTLGGLCKKREKAVYNPMLENDPFLNDTWQEFMKDYDNPANTFNRLAFLYRARLPMLPPATDLTPYKKKSNGKLYIEVDSDYIEILYKRVKVKKRDRNGEVVERWENAKFYDGMKRKNIIFVHCMLLRLITPTAIREQILWGAVDFMVEYIDNTQDPITKHEVSEIVDSAMAKDLRQWQQLKNRYKKTYKVDREVAAQRNIAPKAAALKAGHERATDKKAVKWEKIKAIYNPTKTNKENLKALEQNGLKITPSYLQEWKRENGFTKQGKRSKAETIAAYFDPQLTDGQNVEQLAANGVKVSLKTFKRWKAENGLTKQRNCKQGQKPNKAHESVFYNVVEDLPTNETTCKQGANVGYFSSLDVEDLANAFLNGGTAEHKSVKPLETCKDFDPWDFYTSHHLDGVKYGKDVVKDREELETFKRENRAKGIDPNAMSEEDFLTWLCKENEQAETTSSTYSTVEEDEPF